ncbi:MAG: hypothetical protein RR415_08860 [Ruthenibacterium sp.]
MDDEKRRDKNFKKMCDWFARTAEIAEILIEESKVIKACYNADNTASADEKGIKSAVGILEFLSALYEDPMDYEGSPEAQRNLYPEVAFGLMQISQIVGIMKQNNDGSDSVYGGY